MKHVFAVLVFGLFIAAVLEFTGVIDYISFIGN